MKSWRSTEARLALKLHTETGKSSAYLETEIELCIVKTSHTFVLSDVYVSE